MSLISRIRPKSLFSSSTLLPSNLCSLQTPPPPHPFSHGLAHHSLLFSVVRSGHPRFFRIFSSVLPPPSSQHQRTVTSLGPDDLNKDHLVQVQQEKKDARFIHIKAYFLCTRFYFCPLIQLYSLPFRICCGLNGNWRMIAPDLCVY